MTVFLQKNWGQKSLGLGFLALSLSACVTTPPLELGSPRQELMQSYLTDITKFNGIDEREAVILAQSQLVFHGYDHTYYFDRPVVDRQDSQEWVIRFDPIRKTLAEFSSKPKIYVFISKKDGQVRLKKKFANGTLH